MRIVLLAPLAALLLTTSCKKSDSPASIPNNREITWIKSLGGSNYDFANAAVQNSDGSYVFAGTTRSSDGDVTGTRNGYDAWITKIDQNGAKVWTNAFGGNDEDYATGLAPTQDGGYVISGYTYFNNNTHRAWVIKTDGNGAKIWEKQISQSADAKPMDLVSVGNGTFMVAGYEKTGNGTRDGWIALIDANGNVTWSKNYGGSGEDVFNALVRTSDGNIGVTGYTSSTNGDIAGNQGGTDGWVMKLDGSGNKTWSKAFGGSSTDMLTSITTTTDGGFAVAGNTESSNGDIPSNKGENEAWIVKVDGSGSKQWSKAYGGRNEEFITAIVNTSDGGYLAFGHTNSTTGDVARRDNDWGGWMVKMDASGNKTVTSTYGERLVEERSDLLIKTQDGGYLAGGHTISANRGYDAWLVKVTANL